MLTESLLTMSNNIKKKQINKTDKQTNKRNKRNISNHQHKIWIKSSPERFGRVVKMFHPKLPTYPSCICAFINLFLDLPNTFPLHGLC